ncbi:MAG: hypothetical protein MZV63_00305 [Marinilabiliales bacterium]|nr:hypothetical protein [Marinilabiliales bacterium]
MISLSYKGSAPAWGRHGLEWGAHCQTSGSHDINVNEWTRVDSAGYTVGISDEELNLTSYTDHSSIVNSFIAEGWLISRSKLQPCRQGVRAERRHQSCL